MNNPIIIYRPFPEVDKSVECLSKYDLHYIGRLNIALAIKNILGSLGLYDHNTLMIDNNQSIQYYWNNGNPYLCDLVWYYNVAEELWMDQGGLGYDYLADCWEILNDLDFIENEAPWSEEESNVHKLLLLQRDRAWYKRKFLPYKNFYLKDPSPFTQVGKPRKLTTNNIRKACHEY